MSSYLFIESREPFASRNVEQAYRLIGDLAARGTPGTLFLVQNGVLAARQSADAGQLTALAGQQPPALRFGPAAVEFPPRLDRDLSQALEAGGKRVLVRDDAAVRGIPGTILMPEVEQISRAQLADFLNGFDLVWHW